MKKRIEYFLKTYFYFNSQERRGAGLLGLILVISAGLLLVFRNWTQAQDQHWHELPFRELSMLADTDTKNFNKKTAFTTHTIFESRRFVEHDSVQKNKKYARKTVYINLTDSEALVALPGIGPVMASRIIQYRNKLGGFYQLEQMTEIYGFREDLLYDLQDFWVLDAEHRKILNINTVPLETLQKHPYFKFTLSRAIVNYRIQHGLYSQLEELKNIPLVTDSVYRRIIPYCSVTGVD